LQGTDRLLISSLATKKVIVPLTHLEDELRPIARRRIADGQLPRGTALRMWGGHGNGRPCALCDKPIGHTEVELEVEQHTDGVARTFIFHAVCQSVWQLESARDEHLKKNPLGQPPDA
jgi:hypothetical protein